MTGIIGIVAMLIVLLLSLFITRLAAVALTLTGLSQEAARFQARSAFTGTGFTTNEAESIVEHPVRRRVIMWLMVVRSAGLISIIISLILSFTGGSGTGPEKLARLGLLVAGVLLLWLLSQSRWADRAMRKLMARALKRWTGLDTRDYAGLLHLSGPYTVMEMRVREGDWLARRQLRDCRLREEGVLILGIYRQDGTYLGAPTGKTRVEPDDTLILYGRSQTLQELDTRIAGWAGEEAHHRAVDEQRAEQDRQEAEDARSRDERDQQ